MSEVAERIETEAPLRLAFERARAVDEFEFACALLRVRGLEDAGWDALEESSQLTDQLLELASGDLDSRLRIRLLLMLYCHATEMTDMYAVPANMLRIAMGERYLIDPLGPGTGGDGKAALKPITRAKRIVELASAADNQGLARAYGYIVENRVRNAFFHSSYTLTDQSFRITEGPGVNVGGIVTHEIPLAWLSPKIECAINLSMHIVDATREYRLGYASNKVVLGRMGPDGEPLEVELLGGEGGLVGFRGPV